MDWPHMFSRSAILFALCFDEVALWHRCLLNYGPRDVFITGWGPGLLGLGGVLVELELRVIC